MPEYRVVWEIDVTADNPEQAARIARGYQQWPRDGYWCGMFDVFERDEDGQTLEHHHDRIDLDEKDRWVLQCHACGRFMPNPQPADLCGNFAAECDVCEELYPMVGTIETTLMCLRCATTGGPHGAS